MSIGPTVDARVLLLFVVACRAPASHTETELDASKPETRPWPSSAPSVDACESHDDCTVAVWDGPFGSDVCCDSRSGYMPVAKAYLAFMKAYRTAHCTGVTCPTPPFPGAEPACCAGSARCVAHKCISGCDDPTATYPTVSVISPECRDPRPEPPSLAVDAAVVTTESNRPTGPRCDQNSDCPAHQVCCTVYAGRGIRHQCGKPGTTWSSGTRYEDRAQPSNISTVCPNL